MIITVILISLYLYNLLRLNKLLNPVYDRVMKLQKNNNKRCTLNIYHFNLNKINSIKNIPSNNYSMN